MISTTTKPPDNVSLTTRVSRKIIYSFRFTMYVLMRFVYYFLYKYGILAIPPPPETISTLSTDYISLQKSKFLASFEKPSQDSFNSNIEKCFYDPKLHALEVEDANNELEKTWKRRIMFENTPRGNVIMHYDAFKQGFVYYSDNSNMPYFLLNAVVMKYVLLYRCRDFFIDDQVLPKDKPSPLLNINSTSGQVSTDTSIAKPSEKPALKSSAFVKLKNYNIVSGKVSSSTLQTDKKDSDKPDEQNYTRNKIIHSGKISNFTFLQKTKLVKHVAFSSDLLDGLKSNSDAQRHVFRYKDFKKLKDKQITKADNTSEIA